MPLRFARVDDNLFRGGAPEEMEIPILRNVWGVKWIVSLDEEAGKKIDHACQRLGIRHTIVPLTDGHDKNFDELPSMVPEWSEYGPTFVHCRHGKDRTGVACALYRVIVDGWSIDDALAEAASFGMGWNVPKDKRRSFYDVVRRLLAHQDQNQNIDSPDIVENQRGLQEELNPKPGLSSFNPVSSAFQDSDPILPGQQSFAPYLDVTQDHLNRPASCRRKELEKFAAMRLYRFSRPYDVQVYNTLWASSPKAAMQQGQTNLPDWQKKDAKLFSAVILDDAKVVNYPQEPDRTLIHAAMLKGADVILFQPPSGFDQYLVVNPAVLSEIEAKDSDQNSAPLVGLHDNYDGEANFVFPGSGPGMVPGLSGGAGGFGGFVQVPTQQF
jgi:hypothetical protein